MTTPRINIYAVHFLIIGYVIYFLIRFHFASVGLLQGNNVNQLLLWLFRFLYVCVHMLFVAFVSVWYMSQSHILAINGSAMYYYLRLRPLSMFSSLIDLIVSFIFFDLYLLMLSLADRFYMSFVANSLSYSRWLFV